jgi:dTMP kinase
MTSRGMLIVIEGIDRAGKTTLLKRLVEHFQTKNVNVISFRFPDRLTPIGTIITQYLELPPQTNLKTEDLDDRTIHLLFSANRWEQATFINEELMKGTHVIIDRYAYSGVCYSAAKGIDREWCKFTEIGLPEPDLVLYLDIQPEISCARNDFGNERHDSLEFQKQVYEQFQTFRGLPQWHTIDATLTPDEILQHSLDTILQLQIQEPLDQKSLRFLTHQTF